MPERDLFALDRLGLGGFLHAQLGKEADGSPLTVLSALARLDRDPWATAASWSAMPRAAAVAALVACIAQMPLAAEDHLAAPGTAARLVRLLSPSGAIPARVDRTRSATPSAIPTRIIVSAITCAAILAGGFFMVSRHDSAPHTAVPRTAAADGE